MTKVTRPISYYLAPALIVICMLLAGWNWYLQPGRAGVAAGLTVLLAVMTFAFFRSRNWSGSEGPLRNAGDSILHGIVFGGLMVASALGVKLAVTFGVVHSSDLDQRLMMVIIGAFLASTGNAMPKTLVPLAAASCNGERIQSFKRLAGWTWVLTGLALAIAWLVLPVSLASIMTVPLMLTGALIILTQVLRLRRPRQTEA